MKRRIVITGMGAVTSFGAGADKLWESVRNGVSGISNIERADVSDMPVKVAAEIKNIELDEFIDRKEMRRMDRYAQYAVAATELALRNSGLDMDKVNKERLGVIIGSGVGGIETLEIQNNILNQKGPGRVSPFFVPMMIPNMGSGQVAIRYGAKGFIECVVTACATSTNAIGDAYKVIERNAADVMIAGGAEAAVTRLALAGFCANRTLTTNPDPLTACRPFDLERDGFVMGEGAGVLILEELNHALERGADIVAEVVGYGCTNDAYHITALAEGGEGGARCMTIALEDAGITASEIGYINAHGTSTQMNDKNETYAVKTVFGDYAYSVPMSSTKSMTGHLLGAAGGIEAIICACAIRDHFLPPTINYKTPDPICNLNYIPNKGINADITYAMSNSFGFGGHNATLILKAYKL